VLASDKFWAIGFIFTKVPLDTVTSSNFIEDCNFFSVLSLRAGDKKSDSPQNEVDTSLVKSQLIYFHTKE